MRRNTWLEIDHGVLRQNLQAARGALSPRSEIILVVKANAYSHGMADVATHAREAGIRWFLVARMDEAVELRRAVADANILLLGAVWPTDFSELMQYRITPMLISEKQAEALAAEARRHNAVLPCHAKVDTGMGRFGFPWQQSAAALCRLQAGGGLDIRGLCMHFASAGRSADPFAATQAQRFQSVVEACARQGMTGLFRHISNSAGYLGHPEWDMDGVRMGILMYGYGGRRSIPRIETRPFLQWKTRVVQVRHVPAEFPVGYLSTHVTPAPTCLATIDVGYSDGFSRLMSNKGCVLVGGRRAKVVGRVTMNFTTIDAGSDAAIAEGDEVVLIGRQGSESLWADELARWCQTIPYEILTSIRSEVLARTRTYSMPESPHQSKHGAGQVVTADEHR